LKIFRDELLKFRVLRERLRINKIARTSSNGSPPLSQSLKTIVDLTLFRLLAASKAFQREILHILGVYGDQLSTPESAIKHQMTLIQKKHEHTILRRAAEVKKDADELVAAYRTITFLINAFQVSSIYAILDQY
jgi:hypothetical protein